MKQLLLKLLGNKSGKNKFDIKKSKTIFMYPLTCALGDLTLLTPLFKNLKQQMPDTKLAVFLPKKYKTILDNNPYIDQRYIYMNRKNLPTLLMSLKLRGKFDTYLEMSSTINTDTILFARLLGAKAVVTAKKEPKYGLTEKDLNIYTHVIEFPQAHVLEKNLEYLKPFALEAKGTWPELFLTPETENKFKDFFDTSKVNLLFNFSGAERAISSEESQTILKELAKHRDIIISCLIPPYKKQQITDIVNKVNLPNVRLCPETKSILEAAALIKNADIVISADTAPVHIACTFKKKVISVQSNFKDVIPAFGQYAANIKPDKPSKTNNDLTGFSMEKLLKTANEYIDLTKKEKSF